MTERKPRARGRPPQKKTAAKLGRKPAKKPDKKPRKVLAWFLIFLLVALFGVSLGFAAVASGILKDGTVSPALQALKDMSGSLKPLLTGLIEKLRSEAIPKWMPTIQWLLTTTATTLGIVATIKTLRRK